MLQNHISDPIPMQQGIKDSLVIIKGMSCSEVGTHSEIVLASLANYTRLTVKTFLQEPRGQNNHLDNISKQECNISSCETGIKYEGVHYLTEEHKHAHMELKEAGDTEGPSFVGAQRVKQKLTTKSSLPLLCPNIYLFLAICKSAVFTILALLTLLNLWKERMIHELDY